MASTEGLPTTRDYARPARSIFNNALNFCRSAIAALVRSGIDHISDEMRAVVEELWPELTHKLPPKGG